jgi:hypothetical protein
MNEQYANVPVGVVQQKAASFRDIRAEPVQAAQSGAVPAQIPDAISELDYAVGEVNDLSRALLERLEVVMKPDAPSGDNDPAKAVEPVRAPMADELVRLRQNLQHTSANLRNILSRLQV